jgi:hypothetical protein
MRESHTLRFKRLAKRLERVGPDPMQPGKIGLAYFCELGQPGYAFGSQGSPGRAGQFWKVTFVYCHCLTSEKIVSSILTSKFHGVSGAWRFECQSVNGGMLLLPLSWLFLLAPCPETVYK